MRLLLVVLTLALPATAQAVLVQFRTPSANIGCVYSSEPGRGGPYLRCDILSALKPKPSRPKGCTLDWTFGFQMNATGRARKVCAGDTAVDRRARVLRYGQKWSRGGFACASRLAGLRCRNRSGHGFFLSRGHSFRFWTSLSRSPRSSRSLRRSGSRSGFLRTTRVRASDRPSAGGRRCPSCRSRRVAAGTA